MNHLDLPTEPPAEASRGRKKKAQAGEKVGNVFVRVYSRMKRGYPTFEVSDYSEGKRRLLSFNDPVKAHKEAKRIAGQIATGQATAGKMTNAEAASYGRAMELLRECGVSIEVAAAHFAEAVKVLGSDKVVRAAEYYAERHMSALKKTVSEVADEMITLKTGRGARAVTMNDMRWRLGKLTAALPKNIDAVTTGDIQAWLDGIKGSRRSVVNFRRMAGTLFGFAAARGYIPKGENPVLATEKISGRHNRAVEIFTPEEMRKILAAASEQFRPILALGAFAGLRSAEIERLEWEEIDLAGGTIEIKAAKTKTASRRLVPILPNLRAWLERSFSKGRLWPHSSPHYFECQRTAAKDAGLTWRQNALRHSFISYRLAAVQSAPQVALEAGNSPAMIFANYREIVKQEAAKEWFEIVPQPNTP